MDVKDRIEARRKASRPIAEFAGIVTQIGTVLANHPPTPRDVLLLRQLLRRREALAEIEAASPMEYSQASRELDRIIVGAALAVGVNGPVLIEMFRDPQSLAWTEFEVACSRAMAPTATIDSSGANGPIGKMKRALGIVYEAQKLERVLKAGELARWLKVHRAWVYRQPELRDLLGMQGRKLRRKA